MMRLLPREGRFFDYFNEHAGHAVLAAVELKALLGDLSGLETRRRNIERHEKQADQITHHTMQLLHQTFITPLDRDEIHQLITTMDDMLDLMEDIAQCLFLYDVRSVTAEAQRLAELRPQEQRYWRLFAERKGAVDDRMGEFRWLLEELRVSFFAQELRTPQPVSVKRLDKLWVQLES